MRSILMYFGVFGAWRWLDVPGAVYALSPKAHPQYWKAQEASSHGMRQGAGNHLAHEVPGYWQLVHEWSLLLYTALYVAHQPVVVDPLFHQQVGLRPVALFCAVILLVNTHTNVSEVLVQVGEPLTELIVTNVVVTKFTHRLLGDVEGHTSGFVQIDGAVGIRLAQLGMVRVQPMLQVQAIALAALRALTYDLLIADY